MLERAINQKNTKARPLNISGRHTQHIAYKDSSLTQNIAKCMHYVAYCCAKTIPIMNSSEIIIINGSHMGMNMEELFEFA